MSPSRPRPFFAAVTMVFASTLVACGSDDPAGPGVAAGAMSAMVDGVQWTAPTADSDNTGGRVAFGGRAATGEIIGLEFEGSTTGTYTFSPANAHAAYYTVGSDSWGAGGSGGSGSIVVTTLDATRVAGTFAFEAELTTSGGSPATRSITQGVFDVAF